MRRSLRRRREIGDAGYVRPVRDRVLQAAADEQREITPDERTRLYAESWALSRAGYNIREVHDDDDRAIDAALLHLRKERKRRRDTDEVERRRERSLSQAYDNNEQENRLRRQRRRQRDRDDEGESGPGTIGSWLM